MTNKLSHFFLQALMLRLLPPTQENEDGNDDDGKVVKGWSLEDINFVRKCKKFSLPISIN